jgi:hypothetical protein
MEYLNIIIAVTNFVAFIPIIISIMMKKYILALFIFLTMMSSFIYHLSEHRHGLPGFIFMEYSEELLFIDRVFATFAILYGVLKIINDNFKHSIDPTIFNMVGISLLFIILSELHGNDPYYWTFYHSLWHIFAFLTFSAII